MARSILFVGEDFPGGLVEEISFYSKRSLLDCDIVLFEPPLEFAASSEYKGKPSLDDSASFRLREASSHWRGEITESLATGKTVFVTLEAVTECFIDTGRREYSGTGRNRQTTRVVEPYDNYRWMPVRIAGLTPASGRTLKPAPNPGVLSDYWTQFGQSLEYNLYFSDPNVQALLLTKTGGKAVGGVMPTDSGGHLVLLPPIEWDWEQLTSYDKESKSEVWTKTALAKGGAYRDILLGIDARLCELVQETVPPEWSGSNTYSLQRETELRAEIAQIGEEVERLREQAATKRDEARGAARLRDLLFANGKQLEEAIILALQALGFSAGGYRADDSEFDIVFESAEGRFLGEAEGKDSKAVNVDKLRQLEMNIQEDFERDEVDEYATGVLFGNAFRLTDPVERDPDFFTQKCLAGAKRSGVVLVRTTDLFVPARYVLENPKSATYAKSVRQAIQKAPGKIAEIPAPPSAKETRTALEE